MPFAASAHHYKDLERVVTLAEAARRWRIHRTTIDYAIDAGNVAGIRCGSIVLVSVASMNAWFGQPRIATAC